MVRPAGLCQPLQWLTLASPATAGTAVGPLISAVARSEEVATALVPIAVIPQIILAGVIAPLSGIAQALAKGLVTVYWGREGLERLLPRADLSLIGRGDDDWSIPLLLTLAHFMVAAGDVVRRPLAPERRAVGSLCRCRVGNERGRRRPAGVITAALDLIENAVIAVNLGFSSG